MKNPFQRILALMDWLILTRFRIGKTVSNCFITQKSLSSISNVNKILGETAAVWGVCRGISTAFSMILFLAQQHQLCCSLCQQESARKTKRECFYLLRDSEVNAPDQ